jgi:hypothetical protein
MVREPGIPDQCLSIELHAGNPITETVDRVRCDRLDCFPDLFEDRAGFWRLSRKVRAYLSVGLQLIRRILHRMSCLIVGKRDERRRRAQQDHLFSP